MKRYAGIGARVTPQIICSEMLVLGKTLSMIGFTLASGDAIQADQAFYSGASSVGGNVEIFRGSGEGGKYYNNPQYITEYDKKIWIEAKMIAARIHGNFSKMSVHGRSMHTRNVFQILGRNLTTPAKFVICWTEGAKKIGGTRTAIILAENNKIPVINMADIRFNTSKKVLQYLTDLNVL